MPCCLQNQGAGSHTGNVAAIKAATEPGKAVLQGQAQCQSLTTRFKLPVSSFGVHWLLKPLDCFLQF